MPRDGPWRVPRIFRLYPSLLTRPPELRVTADGGVHLRWKNNGGSPETVALVLMAGGPHMWDYTIYDPELGFLRHHYGPHGDPDRDPWNDVGVEK